MTQAMKYVVILPDGAADFACEALDGQTPLEAAHTPYLDAIAKRGRQGTVATTPKSMACGSDICTMSLLGYDPMEYHTGRAPLEAAAMGIELASTDWVFRVNMVTVIEGLMQDHSAGHISESEANTLLHEFAQNADMPDMELFPGVGYRHILVDRSGSLDPEEVHPKEIRDWSDLVTTPPHDIPGEPIEDNLPVGENATLLRSMIDTSARLFVNHDINSTRAETGQSPATHLWPWGQGLPPNMPSFESRFGLRGAVITAVDLLAGLAHFLGWDRLDVPNQTSYHDSTDYVATGQGAIAALDDYDLIAVHVESPDEAGHAADPMTKRDAISAIDQHVVGLIVEALESRGEPYRILAMPDHYTRCDTRKHDPTPPPFVMAGHRVTGLREKPMSEAHANASDLHIAYGHELMEFFLYSGLD